MHWAPEPLKPAVPLGRPTGVLRCWAPLLPAAVQDVQLRLYLVSKCAGVPGPQLHLSTCVALPGGQ
ncbi:hypothetical protein P7K49_010064 [Saguinus oedipus]|uniref:Uncharacterized protein n=1 Tax=Saguinus oedipus TaxID=9490 RepID=A0ABQ9VP19_SAGOE|nr:hypothetical protein P7K49_010064 [Saguinus oedipus]